MRIVVRDFRCCLGRLCRHTEDSDFKLEYTFEEVEVPHGHTPEEFDVQARPPLHRPVRNRPCDPLPSARSLASAAARVARAPLVVRGRLQHAPGCAQTDAQPTPRRPHHHRPGPRFTIAPTPTSPSRPCPSSHDRRLAARSCCRLMRRTRLGRVVNMLRGYVLRIVILLGASCT